MDQEPPGAAFLTWSTEQTQFWSEPEPESAPGPRTIGAGAAQKSANSGICMQHKTNIVLVGEFVQ